MNSRAKLFISALVLVIYSAILVKVIVFKGPLPEWVHPSRENVRVHLPRGALDEGEQPGRGRGDSLGKTRSGIDREISAGPARSGPRERGHPINKFAPKHANLVPFRTILPQLRGEPRWATATINLIGNTVLFAPVGFLICLINRKLTWPRSLALAVAVGLTMETMQGLLRVGVVDIDDVILNAAGVMSGYVAFRIWKPRRATTTATLCTIKPDV